MEDGWLSAEPPVVSVVIPTTGRPSAADAVASVLSQTYSRVEVIVVYDGAGVFPVSMPSDARVTVVSTGGSRGVAAARTLGIRTARGKYVALLDDDDSWASSKLTIQVGMLEQAEAETGQQNVICASRVRLVDVQGRGDFVVPSRLIRPHESVATYLFDRRRVRWGEAVIHPSTIVCERRLAAATPWAAMTIHEDWDWLLRLVAEHNARVIMADGALVKVTETAGSASRSTKWRESLRWVLASQFLTRRQRADILLCTTAAYAKAAGDRRAVAGIARRAILQGPPGLPACLFFVAFQLLPAQTLTRLARSIPASLGPRTR